ncbi:DEAD/DEAH box helicase [Natranaeroarchaeum sulfidigenes]|uniref:Distinct helicase family with a unique C-terminal domain including a metal-binding cysteine cluster n=1 Tax=Natranaeroarchaeum sulfidigenes TaxID=2784880 RepID=A0A897MKY4_9EURY|nr:DEAD/DEAH box helicase [Natranaeroarchaeum sulfidigenes]QSG02810.1 Distinct helicase family with a unique C-terminal domain including a metal-binding cysteine cluster [Natranaeroarchaeum sulfidigenes]
MTKLTDVAGVQNPQSFVSDEIVERKGPYVEFVDAPAFHEDSAADFLSELDYHDHIIQAITAELFGGDPGGSLYEHQAETISAIESNTDDNILAVPTASGKTEAFFLPILDHCLSSDEDGLKSIVLYPMKTLGVDQLNRFISYLDQINRRRDPDERITIGIWDSDTPSRVGTRDHEIEVGSYVRGLECPRNEGEKLKVLGDVSVGTDDNQYPWLRVTRESIRRGVDILLTGPEALDYMFVSDNQETRSILGEQPGEAPVEHIVFDEAHIWSGIQGAAVSLLSERLKGHFAERDPQITMVSATVDNPTELAADLTGTDDENRINTIEFTPREFLVKGTPTFDRLEPCEADDLITAVALIHVLSVDERTLKEEFNAGNALETLKSVGLVTGTDHIRINDRVGQWLTSPIDDTVERVLTDTKHPGVETSFTDRESVVTSDRGQRRIVESVLETGGMHSKWFDFVIEAVPEVARLAEWFGEDTTGVVGFKHYDELVEQMAAEGVDDPEGVLQTVMAFGRLAGVVTEKYHYFLKPPHKVFWCRDCEEVTRDSRCDHCEADLAELQFCRRCHQPHVEIESDSEIMEDESSYVPVGAYASTESVNGGKCPGCGQSPQLTDIGVPTSSLLSYMLTELCRVSPSKKTLVFSDSRSTAESVGDRIIDTEYGLMAETLYVDELVRNGGQADNFELFRSVSDRLRDEYWDPLIQNDMNEDGTAFNFLQSLLDDIEAHAMLSNCSHLLDSALVTAESVYDTDDLEELLVGHALYNLYAGSSGQSFSKNRLKFDGLTRGKIIDRLESRTGYERHVIDAHLDDILQTFLDVGIITEVPWDEIRDKIQSSNQGEDVKNDTFDFIESARETAIDHDIVEDAESGVFTRIPRVDDSTIVLLSEASFCDECYRSYPVTADGDSLSTCPHCGTNVQTYTRFRERNGELVADPGYADVSSEWEYALDHWAHDITTPIRGGIDPEFISVGIHKGNIPHTLRGAIEEGFRKDDPDVNIVSATPTMELGVDIGTLDTVAQVGIPPTLTNYVQRSGRTGRTRGSSSLVVTAVRGNHPVDSHYYGNLETFLGDFEPVRVPDPYDFDELLAGHVVTETFAYLARNPHESNVFERMYTVDESKENLVNFVNTVTEQLDILREFLLEERRDVVTDHVHDIFGDRGIDIFEQVFERDGPLSLDNRMDKTFSKLTGVSTEGETNKAFTDQNNRLDQWLQRLGYLANYRSFGQQFPVNFTGASDGIEFESEGRLYDMFPGEENDLGAVLTLHGTDYIVDDVHGTATSMTIVAVCDNDECERPFQSYDPETDSCPHCGDDLAETPIHGVSSVECTAARGGQKGYSTRGLQSTYIEDPTDNDAVRVSEERSVFGIDAQLTYGQLEVTDFVYAFERWHTRGSDKEVLRSEAVIERDEASGSTGGSWRDRMDDVEEEMYRPVGQQYFTQGLTINLDGTEFQTRYETLSHESVSWPQAMVSLEQALEKAIAIVAECDRDDFRVKASMTGDEIVIRIVDSRQGGNGITWQVLDQLDAVERRVREVAACERCTDYCDECLLLARTPAFYLDNDLLDRRTLGAIIGGTA